MAISCICAWARGLIHTETSHKEKPLAKSGPAVLLEPRTPRPRGRQGPAAVRPLGSAHPQLLERAEGLQLDRQPQGWAMLWGASRRRETWAEG